VLRMGTEVSPTDPPDLPFVHDLAELVNTVRVAFKGEPGINLKREGDKHVPGDDRECHHPHLPQEWTHLTPVVVMNGKSVTRFGLYTMIKRDCAVVW